MIKSPYCELHINETAAEDALLQNPHLPLLCCEVQTFFFFQNVPETPTVLSVMRWTRAQTWLVKGHRLYSSTPSCVTLHLICKQWHNRMTCLVNSATTNGPLLHNKYYALLLHPAILSNIFSSFIIITFISLRGHIHPEPAHCPICTYVCLCSSKRKPISF